MAKLDDITIGNYQVLTTNITKAYIPYYKNLAAVYSDTKKGTGKVIREQQIRMADMLGLLARVEGRGVTPITRKELKKLENLRTKLYEAHKQVSIWVEESIPFRKDSEKAVKDLGISPKDMKAASENARKAGPERGGAIAQLSRLLGMRGMRPMVGAGVAMRLARPVLGPLAAPAEVGAVGVAGLTKILLGLTKQREGHVDSQRVPGMPEVSRLSGMAGLAGTGVVEGMASTYPRDDQGRFVPRGGLTGIDNIEKGLFKFFNIRALKAKWTRRLLRAVEKGGAGGGALGSDLLGSFSKLKLLLPGLLLALGKGAGLAGAVMFTAFQLHKAAGVAKEWWEVHKNVAESIKKQTKLQIGFLEKLSDTLMKKARKAAVEGDEETRREAVKGVIETQKEIFEKEEKPGLWESWKRGAGAIVSDVKGVVGFQGGGVVTQPTLGVVAENRPEVVTPLSAGNVMDVLKAIKENTAKGVGAVVSAPIDTFGPPFDLADPLLNQLNRTGSLSIG